MCFHLVLLLSSMVPQHIGSKLTPRLRRIVPASLLQHHHSETPPHLKSWIDLSQMDLSTSFLWPHLGPEGIWYHFVAFEGLIMRD